MKMNIRTYQQVDDDKCIEEVISNVIRIEESEDLGLVISNKVFPEDDIIESRKFLLKDIMLIRIEIILKKLEGNEKK